jgi:hypothetical protein
MTARALVTRLSDERMTDNGFHVFAHFIVFDPEIYPGQGGVVSAVEVLLDPTALSNAAWQAAIQSAVVAAAAVMPAPFTVQAADVAVSVFV